MAASSESCGLNSCEDEDGMLPEMETTGAASNEACGPNSCEDDDGLLVENFPEHSSGATTSRVADMTMEEALKILKDTEYLSDYDSDGNVPLPDWDDSEDDDIVFPEELQRPIVVKQEQFEEHQDSVDVSAYQFLEYEVEGTGEDAKMVAEEPSLLEAEECDGGEEQKTVYIEGYSIVKEGEDETEDNDAMAICSIAEEKIDIIDEWHLSLENDEVESHYSSQLELAGEQGEKSVGYNSPSEGAKAKSEKEGTKTRVKIKPFPNWQTLQLEQEFRLNQYPPRWRFSELKATLHLTTKQLSDWFYHRRQKWKKKKKSKPKAKKRKIKNFTSHQMEALEEEFDLNHKPPRLRLKQLSRALHLSTRQISDWFCRHRVTARKKSNSVSGKTFQEREGYAGSGMILPTFQKCDSEMDYSVESKNDDLVSAYPEPCPEEDSALVCTSEFVKCELLEAQDVEDSNFIDQEEENNMDIPTMENDSSSLNQQHELAADMGKKTTATCTDEEPKGQFRCDLCYESFSSEAGLEQHQIKHTGHDSNKCDICARVFVNKKSFMKHKRLHTGRSAFKCDVCAKRFIYEKCFMKHKYLHSGFTDKPLQRRTNNYKCSNCQKCFFTRSVFNKHKRKSCRRFKGDNTKDDSGCGRESPDTDIIILDEDLSTLDNRQELTRQPAMRAGEPYGQYTCGICDKSFLTQSRFNRHRFQHIGKKRKGSHFTEKQTVQLEKEFELNHSPPRGRRRQLSRALRLTHKQIADWFYKRRRKWQKEQKSKRKDMDNEQPEISAPTSHKDDLEQDCLVQSGKKRKRNQFTEKQTVELEKEFYLNHDPPQERWRQLSCALRLTERQISDWFRRRRAKWMEEQKSKQKGMVDERPAPTSQKDDLEQDCLVNTEEKLKSKQLTHEQTVTLKEEFRKNRYITQLQCEQLSSALHLTCKQIRKWFVNRRERQKEQKAKWKEKGKQPQIAAPTSQKDDLEQDCLLDSEKKLKSKQITNEQSVTLKKEFQKNRYITELRCKQLSCALHLTCKQIRTWFVNRRMRQKEQKSKQKKDKEQPEIPAPTSQKDDLEQNCLVDSGKKRKRNQFTEKQMVELEKEFYLNHNPPQERWGQLSRVLHLTERQISDWFRHRRAKWMEEQKSKQKRKSSKQLEISAPTSQKDVLAPDCLVDSGQSSHKCKVCSEVFRYRSHLTEHQQTHTGEKPFQCLKCRKSFTMRSTLNRHMRENCKFKGHIATKEADDSGHQRVSQDVDVVVLDDDSSSINNENEPLTAEEGVSQNRQKRQFPTRERLNCDKSQHADHGLHKCDVCAKVFRHKNALTQHKHLHRGQRSHKCKVCSEAFRNRSCLSEHQRTHTGEKPFQCLKCQKSFSVSSNLYRHMRENCKFKGHIATKEADDSGHQRASQDVDVIVLDDDSSSINNKNEPLAAEEGARSTQSHNRLKRLFPTRERLNCDKSPHMKKKLKSKQITNEQRVTLKKEFQKNHYITQLRCKQLSCALHLTCKQIRTWFGNFRMRQKEQKSKQKKDNEQPEIPAPTSQKDDLEQNCLVDSAKQHKCPQFTEKQLVELQKEFEFNHNPSQRQRRQLSHTLHLTRTQIGNWFCCRRKKLQKNLESKEKKKGNEKSGISVPSSQKDDLEQDCLVKTGKKCKGNQFTEKQTVQLEKEFELNHDPPRGRRRQLSRALHLTDRQISDWFRHRCTKWMEKQKSKEKGMINEQSAPTSQEDDLEQDCIIDSVIKHPFTRRQMVGLEKQFRLNHQLTRLQYRHLSRVLRLTEKQISNWFCKRRIKWKKEQKNSKDRETRKSSNRSEISAQTSQNDDSEQDCILESGNSPQSVRPAAAMQAAPNDHASNTFNQETASACNQVQNASIAKTYKRFTHHQKMELEKEFQLNCRPSQWRQRQLSHALRLTVRQIGDWFYNRRVNKRPYRISKHADADRQDNRDSTGSDMTLQPWKTPEPRPCSLGQEKTTEDVHNSVCGKNTQDVEIITLDDDDCPLNKRDKCRKIYVGKIKRKTHQQLAALENEFSFNHYPPEWRQKELSSSLHLTVVQIKKWFIERRYSRKKKRKSNSHNRNKSAATDLTLQSPQSHFPNKCDICESVFKHVDYLTEHMHLHDGEVPAAKKDSGETEGKTHTANGQITDDQVAPEKLSALCADEAPPEESAEDEEVRNAWRVLEETSYLSEGEDG